MTDYSFIRLLDDFNKAKSLNESPLAENSYYTQVHLLTTETYLQISNTPNGISFQSDYTASLVNCANEVIEDVTKHIFISEFQSSTGLQQIAFEIVNLPTDHGYDVLYLRIESNSNSNYVFWSSPFIVTDDSKEYTTRFDYWLNSDYKGIDYTVSGFKQSIRLSVYFNQALDETDIEAYTPITTGRTVGTRAIISEYDEFYVERFNSYFLRRLNVLLTHDSLYLDCVNSEFFQALEFTERIELSNLIETSFLVSRDQSNLFEFEYQIYEGINAISFTPNSSYTVGNVPENGIIEFNQEVSLEIGEIRLYAEDGDLLNIWNENNLNAIGNTIQTDSNLNIYANTIRGYYFQVDNTLISSSAGELYQGIDDTNTWVFVIQTGEYNAAEYNNDEYITDESTPIPTSIFNGVFNDIYS